MRRPLLHGLLLTITSLAAGYTMLMGGSLPSHAHAFAAPVTGLSLPGVSSSVPAADQSVLRPPAINRTLRAEQPVPASQQQEADQFVSLSASPTPQPAVEEDGVVRAAAVAPTPDLPPYQVYQVAEGDTVTSIAAKFGVDPEYIIANNAEIQNSDLLTLNQSIIVPAGDGILHEVRYGETLSDIAARYDVEIGAITGFAANHIEAADDIAEAQLVFVPGGRVLPAAAPVAEPNPADPGDPDAGATPVPGGGIIDTGPASGVGLVWPIIGPISSYYGPGHPLGIDIDGFNLAGAAVVAATGGTVVFAGGNACCSYGLYVVIVSPEGIETLYAHLDAITVVQGQAVSQGEQIGVIGSSGYSTGRHLHFEVIDNGVRVDPLAYLP